jgi:hypothetical protein
MGEGVPLSPPDKNCGGLPEQTQGGLVHVFLFELGVGALMPEDGNCAEFFAQAALLHALAS